MSGAPPEMPHQIVVVVVYYSSSVSSGVPPDMYSVFYPTWSKIGSLGVAYYVPFGATPTRQVPYKHLPKLLVQLVVMVIKHQNQY